MLRLLAWCASLRFGFHKLGFLLTILVGALEPTTAAYAVGPNNTLNDTGVDFFSAGLSGNQSYEPPNYPRQDARLGRDAAAKAGVLAKIGAGQKGFDFTKIANDGTELPASAALGGGAKNWACTRDNVTGLMWEVKATSGLRNKNWWYSWYDSNGTVVPDAPWAGSAGSESQGACYTDGRCDTEKYVADVNASWLCGYSDWRMPTKSELFSIVDLGRADPPVDTDYFPNMIPDSFPKEIVDPNMRCGLLCGNYLTSSIKVTTYVNDPAKGPQIALGDHWYIRFKQYFDMYQSALGNVLVVRSTQ